MWVNTMAGPLAIAAAGLMIAYCAVVRILRFQRRNSLSSHGFTDRASLRAMTLTQAFQIQRPLADLEFPRTFSISVFFAIFKTYGIPAISGLLAATGQLSSSASASKRAADTGILIVEAVLNEPGSERNLDAVTRMNFLHDRYRKAGKIKDSDMLYTLSLFALEPIRWTRKFEWRPLTDIELCAMGVYWKSMGDQMSIPYGLLPSSGEGWRDGLQFIQELEAWSETYEVKNMVPADTNHQLAMTTINIALTNVPRIFHGVGRHFVSALLEPRLRYAMKLQQPSIHMIRFLVCILLVRKFVIRHFFLPRRDDQREPWFTKQPDPVTGKFHAIHYIDRPWYIEPTFENRNDLISWILWMLGAAIPSKDAPENRPDGYVIRDLGPENMEGKGVEEMNTAKVLLREQITHCPFGHRIP